LPHYIIDRTAKGNAKARGKTVMDMSDIEMFQDRSRSNWVRVSTLVMLRWIAVLGQLTAVLIAKLVLTLHFELGLVILTIAASVVANLLSARLLPGHRRLSEREAALMLAFDLMQLGLLLYLTGGLNNPFALLILAPVTIAATVLHLRSTLFLATLAIVLITVLWPWHLALSTATGQVLELPPLFLSGFWIALLIGILFLGVYARQVTTEMHAMGEALLATQLALTREQQLTDLGGVVAATAHELGTPLATIKLVSGEMLDELGDRPELHADAALIREQADRCRDILRSMGRAGKDDLQLRSAPLESVVREAAEPHLDRGKALHFEVIPASDTDLRQPIILRRPEIVHGLRNLIQNAVDFSDRSVSIESSWGPDAVSVRIADDGPGFPASVIGRIGTPYMRRRRQPEDQARRPGYEGMGLGLFIAKTLLERSGARLSFSNGSEGDLGGGAVVLVEWPRDKVMPEGGALGKNPAITL